MNGGCVTDLTAEVVAAYDAPFPDETYKQGARQFPLLVPTTPDDPAAPANRAAWDTLRRFERPFLCAFSDSDAITRGADAVLAGRDPRRRRTSPRHDRRRRPLSPRGPRAPTRSGSRPIRGRHREQNGKPMISSDRTTVLVAGS